MTFPRQYWSITRGSTVTIVDLYETRNMILTMKDMDRISVRTWRTCDRFLDELRYDHHPDLARWVALPRLEGEFFDPLMAEDWLLRYGQRMDVIDLTNADPDDWNFSDDDTIESFDSELEHIFGDILTD